MNYVKIPFNFLITSTNDYIIQPTNDYIIQPTNDYIIQQNNDYIIQPTNDYIIQPTIIQQNNDYNNDYINVKQTRYNIEPCKSTLNNQKKLQISNNNETDYDENFDNIRYYRIKDNQTYFEHLGESISYSGQAFKASFYFIINAFIPDFYKYNGNITINSLNYTLKAKYEENLIETNVQSASGDLGNTKKGSIKLKLN